jgi:predicted 2-oxoglutarate/Fe(II)-dependent dioxygenase YbiX
MQNLENFISIENVISPQICNKLLLQLETAKWTNHSWYNPVTKTTNQRTVELEVCAATEYQTELLRPVVTEAINKYLLQFPSGIAITSTSAPRFNKYVVGTSMSKHHDHIHSLFDGSQKGIPILSIVGLLNEDFVGGDYVFFEDKKMKFNAGDLMIFPSCFLYPHEITKITKGVRQSFVIWAW